MDISTKTMFKVLAFCAMGALLTGCEQTSEVEKAETIATVLQRSDTTSNKLVAYANYDYWSGKTTVYERHATMVNDTESCKLHGEYHALRSQIYGGGNPVKLGCVTMTGKMESKFECNASEGQPYCYVPGSAPAADGNAATKAPVIKFPALD